MGKPIHVRVTITSQTVLQQSEIAVYLCENLHPQAIHVEPVYLGEDYFQKEVGNRTDWDGSTHADAFVSAFRRAQRIASTYGVPWQTSGSRPGEIHGPYCQMLRQVLQLIPGDIAAACFKTCDPEQAIRTKTMIGAYHPETDTIRIQEDRVDELRREILKRETCDDHCVGVDCFNYYHCSRGCPDGCAIQTQPAVSRFRCRVNQLLSLSQFEEVARQNAQSPNWSTRLQFDPPRRTVGQVLQPGDPIPVPNTS
jgi:hypothetical protein